MKYNLGRFLKVESDQLSSIAKLLLLIWPTCRMPAAVCMRARIRFTWRQARNRRVNWLKWIGEKCQLKIADISSVVSNGRVQAKIMQVCESYRSHLQNKINSKRQKTQTACSRTAQAMAPLNPTKHAFVRQRLWFGECVSEVQKSCRKLSVSV